MMKILPNTWINITLEDICNSKDGLKRGPFGSAIKKEFFVPDGYKVYEQSNAIYDDVNKINNKDELKLFQNLLRQIPSWNDYIINKETSRILKEADKGELIESLLQAVIKSNIMILTNTL